MCLCTLICWMSFLSVERICKSLWNIVLRALLKPQQSLPGSSESTSFTVTALFYSAYALTKPVLFCFIKMLLCKSLKEAFSFFRASYNIKLRQTLEYYIIWMCMLKVKHLVVCTVAFYLCEQEDNNSSHSTYIHNSRKSIESINFHSETCHLKLQSGTGVSTDP